MEADGDNGPVYLVPGSRLSSQDDGNFVPDRKSGRQGWVPGPVWLLHELPLHLLQGWAPCPTSVRQGWEVSLWAMHPDGSRGIQGGANGCPVGP